MSSANNAKLKVAAGIAASFTALVLIVLVLMVRQVITFQMAMLMLVALVGLYVGFGVLIAVYRFIARLN